MPALPDKLSRRDDDSASFEPHTRPRRLPRFLSLPPPRFQRTSHYFTSMRAMRARMSARACWLLGRDIYTAVSLVARSFDAPRRRIYCPRRDGPRLRDYCARHIADAIFQRISLKCASQYMKRRAHLLPIPAMHEYHRLEASFQ